MTEPKNRTGGMHVARSRLGAAGGGKTRVGCGRPPRDARPPLYKLRFLPGPLLAHIALQGKRKKFFAEGEEEKKEEGRTMESQARCTFFLGVLCLD